MIRKYSSPLGVSLLESPLLCPKWLGGLTGLLWMLVTILPAQAAVELRIAIAKGISQVNVGSSTPAIVRDGAGKKLGDIEAMNGISATTGGSGVALDRWRASQIIIEPSSDGYVWINNAWYRGRTRLVRQGKSIIALNQIDLEEYLYSVVGAEAIPTWPQEALKAQAVAARTYAIHQSSTSGNRFYDLDTTTKTQVYKGLSSEFTSTHDAVNATKGEVMTYKGKVILAAFHASSGGHTENVEDIWRSSHSLPYLRGVVDYDQLAPVFQWTKSFSASELGRLLGGVGNVRTLTPERTTPYGRIISIKVVGDRSSKKIDGTRLRQALDLRSTLFTISSVGGSFQVNGRGSGHGIGLSQWGAYYLSEQGVSYQEILSHYYQSAHLTKQF